jgi:hypothetical protein
LFRDSLAGLMAADLVLQANRSSRQAAGMEQKGLMQV